jgi:glycosyltransferase involved in cell wall biosynthesis
VLAAIDPGTEVPRILAESGGGVSVPPDDLGAFQQALRSLAADTSGRDEMAVAGRSWVEHAASPAAVARAYADLIVELNRRR